MCGRFTLAELDDDFLEEIGVERPDPPIEARYNISPGTDVWVVGLRGAARVLTPMRWGLVPSWSNDVGGGPHLVNVRSDSLVARAGFRAAAEGRRCIVPANSFFEWRKTPAGKEPHAARVRDRTTFAMAAIWEKRRLADGPWLVTCAVLTTEASELLAPIHDRMPVILPPSSWAIWLDPAERDVRRLAPLLRPYAPESMEVWQVSREVNRAASEGPELLARVPTGASEGPDREQ